MVTTNIRKIFLTFVVLLALVSNVEASYLNDFYGNNNQGYNQGYGGYGYNNYQPTYSSFFVNDNFNKNSNQFSNLDFGQSSLSNSYSTNTNDFFGEGFLNNNYGDFNQNGVINLNDGYAFNKDPCITKTTHANFKGKKSDFTLTETFCDGISGDFFKNNQYSNSINNNFGYNQGNVGANIYQNSFTNDFNQNNILLNAATSSGYSFGQSTSFGKGTVLVFN